MFTVKPYNVGLMWAFLLFAVCASTDMLDGYVARKYNLVSDLGKALDPVADKLMHVTVMICLSIVFSDKNPPYFILAIIIAAKELIMLLVGLFLVRKKVVVAANIFGKVASTFLSIGVCILFFGEMKDIGTVEMGKVMYLTGFIISAFGVAIALVALSVYAVQIVRQLGGKLPTGEKKIEIDTTVKIQTKVSREKEADADTDADKQDSVGNADGGSQKNDK
jgi:CDP-diacylglycerol--glycerol-3-phosphate 3-phosphatidyltransferase